MKKSLLLIALFISIFTLGSFAQKQGIITVNTSYKGIVEGYDHINRTDIYVDGKLIGSSSGQVQSKPNSFQVKVSRGSHDIRVINMAFYEDTWEEHTIANEYSLDALYEGSIKLKKKLSINLVFDIDKEVTIANVK